MTRYIVTRFSSTAVGEDLSMRGETVSQQIDNSSRIIQFVLITTKDLSLQTKQPVRIVTNSDKSTEPVLTYQNLYTGLLNSTTVTSKSGDARIRKFNSKFQY